MPGRCFYIGKASISEFQKKNICNACSEVDENHESSHNFSDMICFSQALCHSRASMSIAAFAMAFGSLVVGLASKNTQKSKRGKTFQDDTFKDMDCRSCQHGCKANLMRFFLLQAIHHQLEKQLLMLILNIRNGLQVIIWLPLRCIFAFALSTLHIEDGRSRL